MTPDFERWLAARGLAGFSPLRACDLVAAAQAYELGRLAGAIAELAQIAREAKDEAG